MTFQYGFYINSSVCSGCKACEIACRDKNDLDDGRLWRHVIEVNGGGWSRIRDAWQQTVFAYNLSIACNHCENPMCMTVCPTKSIYKREDGIVLINEDTCAGCCYCEWACPYGAPKYNEKKGKMTKCNFCFDRIDRGDLPLCVSVCGLRALEFGKIDVIREKKTEMDPVYPLPDNALTRPSIVINPHQNASMARKIPTEIVCPVELI